MPTKDEILCALAAANIEVSPTATISQLRRMNEENVAKAEECTVNNGVSSQENTCIDDAVTLNEASATVDTKMEEYTRNGVGNEDTIVKPIVHEEISEASLRFELIVLREKVKAMELRHPNTDGRLAHPEEVKYLIPEFSDGLGISQWLKTIQHNSEIYGWQDRTKLLYASGRLTGAAREWFDGFRNSIKTFDEFTDEIKKAFPDQANEALIHSQLASVSKKPSESYNSYVYRVNALGKKGRVSEEAIIT
ncbi:uncharacterized protein LOC118513957 [Anopheles stephensi]|uniref:uncharacterized protein LOC118513957 n=1 Tax=Anopheles stephensi TaxID=30069 RepID=UPI0016587882|nr:uncharacterized protein LOC118513957 [Anopheles stephensi]